MILDIIREYAIWIVGLTLIAIAVSAISWISQNIMYSTYLSYIKSSFEPWGYGYVNDTVTKIYLTNIGYTPYIAEIFINGEKIYEVNEPVGSDSLKEISLNGRYGGVVTISACHYEHRNVCKLFSFELINLTKLLEIAKNITSINVSSSSSLSNVSKVLAGWYSPVEETAPGYVNLLIGISPSNSRGFAKIIIKYSNNESEKYLLYTLGSEELEEKFSDEWYGRTVTSKYIVTTVTSNTIVNLLDEYYRASYRYYARVETPCGSCRGEDCLHNNLHKCKAFAYVNGKIECFDKAIQGVLELNNIPAGTNITIQVFEPLIACRPRIYMQYGMFALFEINCLKVPNPNWHFYAFISNIFGKIDNTTTITFTTNKSGWISIVYAPAMDLMPINFEVKLESRGLVDPKGIDAVDIALNVEGTSYKVMTLGMEEKHTLELPPRYEVSINAKKYVIAVRGEKCGCGYIEKGSKYEFTKIVLKNYKGNIIEIIKEPETTFKVSKLGHDGKVEVWYRHVKSWTRGSCTPCPTGEEGGEGGREKPPPPEKKFFYIYMNAVGTFETSGAEKEIIGAAGYSAKIKVYYIDKDYDGKWDSNEPIVGDEIEEEDMVCIGWEK